MKKPICPICKDNLRRNDFDLYSSNKDKSIWCCWNCRKRFKVKKLKIERPYYFYDVDEEVEDKKEVNKNV